LPSAHHLYIFNNLVSTLSPLSWLLIQTVPPSARPFQLLAKGENPIRMYRPRKGKPGLAREHLRKKEMIGSPEN
jgi:hypothetical protein